MILGKGTTESESTKLARKLQEKEQKLIDRISKDIELIDRDIRDIQVRIKQIPEYNKKDYLNMMKLLSQFRRDRESLVNQYHAVVTDINYKNKLVAAKALEAETIIRKILEKDSTLSGFQEDFMVFFEAMRDEGDDEDGEEKQED